MPISEIAIDRFLRASVPEIPKFKGADPEQLIQFIIKCTGVTYTPKTAPRPHQLEGIAFALYLGRSLLYYSCRLGKSLISLQWAELLKQAGLWKGKGIIICHAPIALWVWESEAEKHSTLTVRAVRNKLDELLEALDSDADLIVIPWSGLQNIFAVMRENRKGKNKLYPDLEGVRIAAEAFSLAIIDEIHSAKNWQSLRFVLAKELLRNCRFRVGLTGTPFGRNPYDVWSQAYLIDQGATLGQHFKFFEAAFGTPKENWYNKQVEYIFDKKKQSILERKLASISLPYKLEECQNVPVFPGRVDLRMSGDQEIAYSECVDKLIKLDDREVIEIQAVFIRLRQISSGYLPFQVGQEVLKKHFKSNAKQEWLLDFLETAKESKIAIVIFHDFTDTGKLICDTLGKAGVGHLWLHGATKDKPGACKAFQEGKVDALVVQSATGSLAIDLHRADYMLFFESPVSPIVRAQAEARPLSQSRGGRPLLVDDLTCSGVERKILSYVSEGKDLMSSIIHDRKSLKEGIDVRREGAGLAD